jgi:hypothetical protein
MIIDFLLNPWTIGIGTGVIVVLVTYHVFGIGKPKKTVVTEPFKVKYAEEEITFEEKLRSLKMDVIKVNAHDHTLGIRAEYAWINNAYPKNKRYEQLLMKFEVDANDSKKRVITFDVHQIELEDGREKKIYFEIDSFFADGKPASFEPGYRDQKLKDIYSE